MTEPVPTTPDAPPLETTTTPIATGDTPAAKTSVLAPKPDAPEIKYDLKAPEGVNLDPKDLEGIAAFAKDNKLSPEAAQKILERDISMRGEYSKQFEAAKTKQIDDWSGALEADKDFGGAKYDENIAIASKGLHTLIEKKIVPAEFKQMLEKSGLYAEPNIVRILHHIGKLSSEQANFAKGSSSPIAPKATMRDYYA